MPTYGPVATNTVYATDAEWRNWVQNITDALTAAGMVQTADTGQINPVTVLRPTVINTIAGYQIWRFNDALQATAPIFIKIQYGVINPAAMGKLVLEVGQGSNGSGTLTGTVSTVTVLQQGTQASAGSTLNLYASGGAGRLMLFMGPFTATNLTYFFIVERTRDLTGAATVDGVVVFSNALSAVLNFQVVPKVGALTTAKASWPAISPFFTRPVVGTDIGVASAVIFLGKPFYLLPLVATGTDFPGGTTAVIDHLGASRTFLSLAGALAPTTLSFGNNSTDIFLVPFE